MNRFSSILALVCGAVLLTSCRLPRNQAEVMHGKVHGGDVPLYKTGSIDEFYRAGLILPDVGGYVRAEFDVLDVGKDGSLISSSDSSGKPGRKGGAGTVAQLAIPRLVSSYDLSRSKVEMRAAAPAADKPATAAAPPAGPVIAAAKLPASTPAPAKVAPATPAEPPAATLPARPAVVIAAAPVHAQAGVKDVWTSNPYVTPVAGAGLTTPASAGEAADPLVASSATVRTPLSSPANVPWAVGGGLQVASLP